MTETRHDTQRIKRITRSVIGLPTLPTVVSKMIELVDNPKTSAASLANLISTDQSLTARILKLANSAYYGFSREISTVNMAIVVMGFNAVREMGLSLSVFDILKDSEGTHGFDISKFWEHSIACGVGAKAIVNRYNPSKGGEAFVAGLLHDIGKVVLVQYLKNEFSDIVKRMDEHGESLEEAEEKVMGVDHGRIGGWLAEKWCMPGLICECINYHHFPSKAKNFPVIAAAVGVSDYICHRAKLGGSGRKGMPRLSEETWEIMEKNNIPVSDTDIEDIENEILFDFDKTSSAFSFMFAGGEDEEL